MIRRKFRLALIAFLAFGMAVLTAQTPKGEDGITLKLKKLTKGDTTYAEITETNTVKTVIKNGKEVIQQENAKVIDTMKFVEEILDRQEGKKPSKLKRAYQTASRNFAGKDKPLEYQNKTLLIERKKEGYEFLVEGGKPLTGEQAELLLKEFSKPDEDRPFERLFFPAKPVKTGETWKVDLEPIAKELAADSGFTFNVAKATGTGKIVKISEKFGKNYAELEIDVALPLTGIGTQVAFAEGATFNLKFKYDGCIDGTITDGVATLEIKIKADGTIKENGFTVAMDIEGQIVDKRMPVKK
jgi:hypothetical protein